jgi:hypothetical protein
MTIVRKVTHVLWSALGELDERFACLGGAACYQGYRDEAKPIGILILLQKRFPYIAPPDALDHFINPQFWEACEPVIAQVRARIDAIETLNEDTIRLAIHDFTQFVNARLKKDEMHHWPSVVDVVSRKIEEANMNGIAKKPRKYINIKAYWGNDDAESTIRISRRSWRMINEGSEFTKSTWSWYEGKRYPVTWTFDNQKVSIDGIDGMQCLNDDPIDTLIVWETEG